jgi:serine/threonine protein kinase
MRAQVGANVRVGPRFLEEVRTLARLRHSSIVRVARVFEAAFDCVHGYGLRRRSALREMAEEARSSANARCHRPLLLDALQMTHAENFLHRDIAPDKNIKRTDGSPAPWPR